MTELDNPYAPPEADDEAPISRDAGELDLASQGARFVNFVIDSFTSGVLVVVIVAATGISPDATQFLNFPVLIAYFVICEMAFQATLGKLITGTRVVSVTGAKPRFGQILGRTLSRCVPFEPFSCTGKRPVGWHDRWSNTRVVTRRSLRG